MVGLRLRAGMIAAGLGLVGVFSLAIIGAAEDSVRREMRAQAALARAIPGLIADAKNAEAVAAQKHIQAELAREVAELYAAAERINRREPVLADVFPDGGQVHRRVRFAELYRDALDEFVRQLRGGGPPTPAEIEAARQDLAEAAELRNEEAERTRAVGMSNPPRHGVGRDDEAVSYASVLKARGIRCYVHDGVFERRELGGQGSAPSVEQLWLAQVELWIQRDVVGAIAEMNDEAARVHGRRAGVEQMPVKRIWGVRVLGYQLRDGLLLFPTPDGLSCEVWKSVPVSFTGRACDGEFDVVVFQMVVVMDQRDVLQLIDRVGKRNFYQCTAVAYEAVPEPDANAGYVYGTEPVVCVGLEFEWYMWREIYGPLMPAGVRRTVDRE
ncbi:MAG: hypothetical protein KKI02_12460 [Planctomycetes bacterium]|nr:hypothetical protein [Planctomycetota bacterium]